MSLPNAKYVQMALVLANQAISEMKILSDFISTDKDKFLNGPPFRIYALSLEYMFLMEITKLLEEPKKSRPLNHHASIQKAAEELIRQGNQQYEALHSKNLMRLDNLRSLPIFKYIKELRDKKFAHTDGDSPINPLSIPIFNSDEILDAMDLLRELYDIWDTITVVMEYNFERNVPFNDDRTMNFLKYHSVYKRYYMDNYIEADSRGYKLN